MGLSWAIALPAPAVENYFAFIAHTHIVSHVSRFTGQSTEPLHIGCAAGFSGDRTDAAAPLVAELLARGGAAVLVFETLAERTLALAQLAREADPAAGFEPLLDDMLAPVLGPCLQAGVRIIGNFGAANPQGAARRILAMAASQGLRPPRVAVLEGDDVLAQVQADAAWRALVPAGRRLVSANAYLGGEGIAAALREGADIVVCGRIADPALVVGPALAHFGWAADDWQRLAGATMAGHLLECGTQVSGGYFADPGYKEVPRLAEVGFPLAALHADGHCVISKPAGTGGRIDRHTVTEQLLYEIHDPLAYVTPDVVADIGQAELIDLGSDRVLLKGVRGHARPATLKVALCHDNGWLAEGEISYAGPRAQARARLAAEVLHQRLRGGGRLRTELIGVHSVFAGDDGGVPAVADRAESQDVRLRAAWSQDQRRDAERLLREVTALYTNGPAAGGGVRTTLRPRLGLVSGLMARERVPVRHRFVEAA